MFSTGKRTGPRQPPGSLFLCRGCHDQPSLVGDPRSLIGRHHSLLLARDVLHAIDHAVRVDLRAGGGVGAKGPFFYRPGAKEPTC